MNIYDRIRECRQSQNMSQFELAQLTGYTDRSSIAKIEAGKVDLPQSKIKLFASVLGTTSAYLMGYDEEVSSPQIASGNSDLHLSTSERNLVIAYRTTDTGTRNAVDKLLDLSPAETAKPKDA